MQNVYLNFKTKLEVSDLLNSSKWLLSESIFTSLTFKNGVNHSLKLHFERLNSNLEMAYGIQLSSIFVEKIQHLIVQNCQKNISKLRLEFFRKDLSIDVKSFEDLSHLLVFQPMNEMTLEQKVIALSSQLIEKKPHEFSSIKTSEYAFSQFKKSKFKRDFLYMFDGNILEASTSAIGFVKNNKLYVSKLKGQLQSVSLKFLLQSNLESIVDIEQVDIKPQMLEQSTEIILFNSVRGIIPVSHFGELEKTEWKKVNSITQKIATFYQQVFYN